MSGPNVIQATQENWQSEVMESTTPVLVDFWAAWCGPCRQIAPVLDELAAEMQGQIKVAKVDVDQSQGLAAQFNVRSIPTLLIVKDGVVVQQMAGAMPKSALKTKIEAALAG